MIERVVELPAAAPEVVLRVQAISDAKALKRQMDRMFELGQPRYADLYDPDDEAWDLLHEIAPSFVQGWAEQCEFGEGSHKRLIMALAVTFSMPVGVDFSGQEAAALAVARVEFGSRQRVWVAGEHEGPFAKFLVEYRDEDDRPLSHGPADLRRYRDTYARELGVRGVPALATSRRNRGLGFAENRNALKARERLEESGA